MIKSSNPAIEPSVSPKRAKFEALVAEGIDPKPRIKRGIIIPNNKDPKGGLVLRKDDAINAGWVNPHQEWDIFITERKEQVPALIFTDVRLCIVSSTPNYAEGKKEGEFLGIIDWETYQHDRDLTKVCQNYLLMLLDHNYQPLHKRALHYKAHGNAGLAFTQALVGSSDRIGFYQEMDSCLRNYYDQQGIVYQEEEVYKTHFNSATRVEQPYHNCSVINLSFHAEMRGNKDNVKEQSLCSLVKDWEHPTVDNFDSYWRDELKPVIAEMLVEAEGWSRKQLKNPQVLEILPYDDGFSGRDLKNATSDAPDEVPY